jgi:hypothetical protein
VTVPTYPVLASRSTAVHLMVTPFFLFLFFGFLVVVFWLLCISYFKNNEIKKVVPTSYASARAKPKTHQPLESMYLNIYFLPPLSPSLFWIFHFHNITNTEASLGYKTGVEVINSVIHNNGKDRNSNGVSCYSSNNLFQGFLLTLPLFPPSPPPPPPLSSPLMLIN